MAENELLKPKNVVEMLLISTKYWTVTSPQGNLATGNLATALLTSPHGAK